MTDRSTLRKRQSGFLQAVQSFLCGLLTEQHQLDLGLHLFHLREMEDPLVKRLLEADESITRQPEEGNMAGKFVDEGENGQE